jgi:hypothetical protein
MQHEHQQQGRLLVAMHVTFTAYCVHPLIRAVQGGSAVYTSQACHHDGITQHGAQHRTANISTGVCQLPLTTVDMRAARHDLALAWVEG